MKCVRSAAWGALWLRVPSSLWGSSSSTRLLSHGNTPPSTEDYFLSQIEQTIQNVFDRIPEKSDILSLPAEQRESLGTARHLHRRIRALRRNNDCPRCWLQRKHCICSLCPPLTTKVAEIDNIFLVMQHKEVGMAVDTAKILLAALPCQTKLVIAGISATFQPSMQEMQDALDNSDCLVLFPDENAREFMECREVVTPKPLHHLFVIDGTWDQARKIYKRYFYQSKAQSVCLSTKALEFIAKTGSGRQLRHHPEKWREISTLEATRLLLQDIDKAFPSESLAHYQEVADAAARVQLGPPRTRKT